MTDSSISLILGTALALGALSYVLYPLLREQEAETSDVWKRRIGLGGKLMPDPIVESEEGLAVEALKEIEFDRATGKLSDSDYDELKTKYTVLAEGEAKGGVSPLPQSLHDESDDPVEAAVRRAEARRPKCRNCGPRPESDAAFCSDCGSFLASSCPGCGSDIELEGARFCNNCGIPLSSLSL